MSFRINTNVTAMNALRNLGTTGQMFNQSVNRLSTGMRINSAADDPAGLIFSENFRAQISGVNQAIRNNQDALNYAKTAEGALDELARLLRDGRSLAVGSANTAILDSSQLQANQTQWNQIVASVNRIATETQFGKKRLLDGSSGVVASVVKPATLKSLSLSGTWGGNSITAGNVDVNVTTAAARATVTSTKNVTGFANLGAFVAGTVGTQPGSSFSINGTQIAVNATDTWGDVVARINSVSSTTGVIAEAQHDGTNGTIKFSAIKAGTIGNFTIADPGIFRAGSLPGTLNGNNGVNAVATVTIGGVAVTMTGGLAGNDGTTLTDSDGNAMVLQDNVATGNVTQAAVVQVGLAQFQTGGNANQRTTLNIGSFTASSLSLNGLDFTSSAGATSAIQAIDSAIAELSRKRGDIGSFSRNVLESNVRSLGIAKENLSSTESSVRDVDVAEEMTNYTRLQILQQSGLAVLAQANSAPQGVLSLLRG